MTDYIDTPGARLRLRLDGGGESLIVLVHELGGCMASWDAVVPALTARGRVLRYDMRGFGESTLLSGDLSIDDLADDLSHVIAAAGPFSRLVLIGNAVGAAACVRYLNRMPLPDCAAILISPALGVDPQRRAAVRAIAQRLMGHGMAAISAGELALSYPDILRNQSAERFELYRQRFDANDAAGFAAYFRMLAALDLGGDAGKLDCPILVLSGSYDAVRPPSQGRALADRLANARFAEVKSGHFMAYQTPELFLQAAGPFLDRYLSTSFESTRS